MKLDARALFEELGIPYESGGKHGSPGWVQLACPYCDDGSDDHLGFNLAGEYFNCWKCGWHPLVRTVAELAGIADHAAAAAIDRNRTGRPVRNDRQEIRKAEKVTFPLGTAPLRPGHLKYLRKRGFSDAGITRLVDLYGVRGTGPAGEYCFRLVFPIKHYGRLVSWQTRDITGRDKRKYLACPKEQEVRDHKDCLYASDLATGESVVVVEGVMDALKLGPGAVATFGAGFSWAQVRELADRWRVRYVALDPDAAGRKKSAPLAAALASFPGETYAVDLGDRDPGDMTETEAAGFMESLGFKRK